MGKLLKNGICCDKLLPSWGINLTNVTERLNANADQRSKSHTPVFGGAESKFKVFLTTRDGQIAQKQDLLR